MTGREWRSVLRADERPLEMADALERAATRLRAGSTLLSALAPGSPPITATDRQLDMVTRHATAHGLDAALERWARGAPQAVASTIAGLRLVGRLGGSPAQLIDQLAADARAMHAHDADRRAGAAQAYASAVILAVLPLAMLSLSLMADPATRGFLTRSGGGAALVGTGLALDAAGFAWMARICRYEPGPRVSGPQALIPVVSQLRLAATAGLSVTEAVRQVAAVQPSGLSPWSRALGHVAEQSAAGIAISDALDQVRPRAPPGAPAPRRPRPPPGDAIEPLVTVLQHAARYGVALGPALDRVGFDLRNQARRAAEIDARRVPLKMLAPLVTCQLPAFILLTVAPALVTSLQSLPAA